MLQLRPLVRAKWRKLIEVIRYGILMSVFIEDMAFSAAFRRAIPLSGDVQGLLRSSYMAVVICVSTF